MNLYMYYRIHPGELAKLDADMKPKPFASISSCGGTFNSLGFICKNVGLLLPEIYYPVDFLMKIVKQLTLTNMDFYDYCFICH